jgi:HSP20 family protein
MYEKKSFKTEESDIIHREERAFGKMQRSLALPTDVSEDGVKAEVDRGVLCITIPKLEGSKAQQNVKRVPVLGK